MSDQDLDTSTATEEETDFEAAFNEHAEAKEDIGVDEELDSKLDDDTVDGLDKEKIAGQDDKPDDKEKIPKEDFYAGMSETAKAHFTEIEENNKNLNHRLDSDAGRVSAFQIKINKLDEEIQGLREGNTAGEQPSKTQIADAMSGSDEGWEQFTEDYPEVAKAIDSRLSQAGKATQETIENTLTPIKEKAERDAVTEKKAALNAAAEPVTEIYPTWTEAVQTQEFALWLDEQSPGIQALTGSDDSKDASLLIGLYDTHLVAEGQPSLKAEEDTTIVPGPGDEKPNKIAEKRKQQLEDGATIKSKNSRIDPGAAEADDFESAFNFHAARKDRQRANG